MTRPGRFRLAARALLSVLVIAVVGFAAAWLQRREPAHSASIAATLLPSSSGDLRFQVFVFVDPTDCRGNLSFVELFRRDTVHFHLRKLLLLGAADSLPGMKETLRQRGISQTLESATARTGRVPALLGARGTPFLVIIDPDGVVRLAMYSPPSMDTYAKFPALMRALVDQGLTDPLLDAR